MMVTCRSVHWKFILDSVGVLFYIVHSHFLWTMASTWYNLLPLLVILIPADSMWLQSSHNFAWIQRVMAATHCSIAVDKYRQVFVEITLSNFKLPHGTNIWRRAAWGSYVYMRKLLGSYVYSCFVYIFTGGAASCVTSHMFQKILDCFLRVLIRASVRLPTSVYTPWRHLRFRNDCMKSYNHCH